MKKIFIIVTMLPCLMVNQVRAFSLQEMVRGALGIVNTIEPKHVQLFGAVLSLGSAFMGSWYLKRYLNTALFASPVSEKSTIAFKDYIGVPEEVERIVKGLPNMLKQDNQGVIGLLPKAWLFTGSPGSGKTLLANAAAGELKCPLFHFEADESLTYMPFIGKQKLKSILNKAREAAKNDFSKMAIVFIDEIHAIAQGDMLNALLLELSGSANRDQKDAYVLLIGATDRPMRLDEALTRSGRFKEIVIDTPNAQKRNDIIQYYLKKHGISMDAKCLVEKTEGFTPADIRGLVQQIGLLVELEKANPNGKLVESVLINTLAKKAVLQCLKDKKNKRGYRLGGDGLGDKYNQWIQELEKELDKKEAEAESVNSQLKPSIKKGILSWERPGEKSLEGEKSLKEKSDTLLAKEHSNESCVFQNGYREKWQDPEGRYLMRGQEK